MNIVTQFSCGDSVWIISRHRNGDRPMLATVGQVRVTFTDSKGVNDGAVEPGCSIQFDNYKPQKSYEEGYMCDETGIGTGTVHYIGKSIFATERGCLSAIQAEKAVA